MQPKILNQTDSTVLFEHQGVFNDIPALYQSWQFDGLAGESIMFNKKDMIKTKLNVLVKQLRASKLVQTHKPITISHNPPGHVCLIFNFEMSPNFNNK